MEALEQGKTLPTFFCLLECRPCPSRPLLMSVKSKSYGEGWLGNAWPFTSLKQTNNTKSLLVFQQGVGEVGKIYPKSVRLVGFPP